MNVNRVRHLENAISHFDRLSGRQECAKMSIDSHLRAYFRAHKMKLDQSDKEWLSEKFKDLYRWKGLITHFMQGTASPSNFLRVYFGNTNWRAYANSRTLAGNICSSMPEELFKRLTHCFGKDKALDIGKVWNESSVTFLRVNPLVDDRERVYKFLASKGISVEKSNVNAIGLRITRSDILPSLKELKEHSFDIQDESCQMVGLQIDCNPGDKVLDFCCGSGGKSLVFGPQLKGKGHLFLHDVNEFYLKQAKRKLYNAKIRNFSCLTTGSPQLDSLKRKMDWILVDVPSTGSGQFRRYPERKWLYSDESLQKHIADQREIFKRALTYLSRKGKIVYSTSSILPDENMEQVKHFCESHKLYLVKEPVFSLPQSHGMDGFFSAVLERR